MELIHAIILGIIQGLTEFLPVSSSGHLVLAEEWLNTSLGEESNLQLAFNVVVHFGTALSVIVYFHKRLLALFFSLFDKRKKEEHRMIFFLFLGTLPAVILVLLDKSLFGGQLDEILTSFPLAGAMLLLTGVILQIPQRLKPREGVVTGKRSVIVGIAQAFAILPGISRSGSTIVAAITSGIRADRAAEFSFLLAIPAIMGGMVFSLKDLSNLPSDQLVNFAIGGVASFLSGLFAVYLVLAAVRKGKLGYFGYYCFAMGAAALIWYFTYGNSVAA
ncbi:undecaprenyl-diphosphate phosphatase [Sulfuriroseicoccus oceanibius]|uniref:Undecaprenyl-diphosphatase n=1 Tax=Sulfuriroseicoccus oceanibius TaxID=2707525 RepID=A0A6B3LFE0_9BACT|nr:undecaprenyl-diphosphate phosphatase [Sulfuriroseicoccus oceanibius]QQL44405.1 undecaprenyl-diphosphate phosphatase [Sulfuriroseicoccus oceanibius]